MIKRLAPGPMRLLLINPNTSAHITERLARSARAAMAPGDQLTTVTAQLGPAAVRSPEDLRTADASAIELAGMHAPDHDAIVLGISLDGVAVRLRCSHPELPVVGMTEAALFTACMRSERIGLLTLGAELLPLYRQRVDRIGISSRVVAYRAPDTIQAFEPGAAAVDPVVLAALVEASERLREEGAESVVLAGAVLCGYADAIATCCRLPVFDGVSCAVGQLRNLSDTWQHHKPGAG